MAVQTEKKLRRFLIHDDLLEIKSRGFRPHHFRVRIYCGTDLTPIVLVSQVAGGTRPTAMPNRIANVVAPMVPRYDDFGMLYFDVAMDGENAVLHQQYHETYDSGSGVRLCKAMAQAKEWGFLEGMIGEPIERY